MKIRSIFILMTFIVLIAINKVSLQTDIKKQNLNFSVVNTSGKQRMYSQKISKLAIYKLNNFNDTEANNNVLKTTLKNFKKDHKRLINLLYDYDNRNLNYLYDELDFSYTSLIENTNKLISENSDSENAQELVNQIKISSEIFLPKMDEIVNMYERIGRDKGEVILQRELTFNFIILGMSLYVIIFVIKPSFIKNRLKFKKRHQSRSFTLL